MLLRCWDLWYRLLRYMSLRCWDLWYRLLRYIHVATLLRSLGSFTTLHTCCYAAQISGIVYYVTYMLLRCWDLWDRLLRYIHVATLLRSLVSFTTLHVATLLRSLGSFTTLHVATLLRSLGSLQRYIHVATLLRSLRSLRAWQWRCIHKNADCQLFTTHALQRWRWKTKNAPQVFPGFPIIKLARHCGKITIFFKKCAFYGNGFRSGGMYMYMYMYIHIYIYIHMYIHMSHPCLILSKFQAGETCVKARRSWRARSLGARLDAHARKCGWCAASVAWMGTVSSRYIFFFAGNLVDFYQKGRDMILHLRVVIVPYIACRFRDLELFMALVSVTLAVVGTIFLYWANEIKGIQRYRKCDEASGSALALR